MVFIDGLVWACDENSADSVPERRVAGWQLQRLANKMNGSEGVFVSVHWMG